MRIFHIIWLRLSTLSKLTLNRLSCSTFLMAISASGSSVPSSRLVAVRQSLYISSCSRLCIPNPVLDGNHKIFRRLTQHLGGKDDTERTIPNDLAIGIAQLTFLARLAIGRTDSDDEVGVISYPVSYHLSFALFSSWVIGYVRVTLTPFTRFPAACDISYPLRPV